MDTSRETIENLIANQRRALVGMGGNIDVPALTEALERLLNERDAFRAQRDEARLSLKLKSPWPSCDEPSMLCERPAGHKGAHSAIRADGVRMYWSNDYMEINQTKRYEKATLPPFIEGDRAIRAWRRIITENARLTAKLDAVKAWVEAQKVDHTQHWHEAAPEFVPVTYRSREARDVAAILADTDEGDEQ